MRRYLIMFRLCFIRNASKKAKYLRKTKVFHNFGNNCSWHSNNIPSEPELVSISDNVHIASNVRFITHDICCDMFNRAKYGGHFSFYTGEITIGKNVMIGADAIIMYNVSLGNDVIIAAGSVVTKNVPSGEIWGGAPARKIGLTMDLVNRRRDK